MKTTLLFLILFSISCNNHPEKVPVEKITNQDIYRAVKIMLNDLVPNEKIEGTHDCYLSDQLALPSFVEENPSFKLDKYFTKDDIKSIKEQISKRRNFKLLQDSIPSKRLLPKEILDSFDDKNSKNRRNKFWENYQKKYGNTYYYTLSIPIFSNDKKSFMIDVSFMSGGQSYLFKKTNGKWTSKIVSLWVS